MNLVTGRIVEIFLEDGVAKAKVDVDGVFMSVPLMLVMNTRVGDEILVGSGVAIAKVEGRERKEPQYVSGDSR
jgi:hydrogenase maturation factor